MAREGRLDKKKISETSGICRLPKMEMQGAMNLHKKSLNHSARLLFRSVKLFIVDCRSV